MREKNINIFRPFRDQLNAIWRYKGFIWGMVAREFRARYLGSLLGSLWSILNPLAMITVYTVIFSKVMGARLAGSTDTMAYGIFLCAGLLSWNYFSELLNRCQTIFIEQANLIKKVNFPRITLPVILVISTSINFAIIFCIFLFFLIVTGRFPGISILGYIPLLLLQQGFALGLGIFLGTLNVFFRDIGQLIGIVLQFWFWFTPLVYPISILSERTQHLIMINPMTQFAMSYQNIILHNKIPHWSDIRIHLIITAISLVSGIFIFSKLSNDMVDEL